MKEQMPTSGKEMSPQDEMKLLVEMKRRNEERLNEVAEKQAVWAGNVQTLDEKVPHDDVIQDDRTLSYSVLRNHWMSMIAEGDVLLVRLRKLQETLDEEIAAAQGDKALEALAPEELN
ncbi:MAG: hypothetical protein RDU25_05925 [Patescibacteria group bacterium]|nr:hypothetical protein [Patescibacteria group bacterium]